MDDLATGLTATESDRLDQAAALVRSYCGWHIAKSQSGTTTFTVSPVSKLFLPSLYVTAISTVKVGDDALDSGAYRFTENGVVSRVGGRWFGTIEVDFTHGYTDPPPDVTAVVQAVAQRAVGNPGSIIRKQAGPFSETQSQVGFNQAIPIALLSAEKSILDHYRIPSRP